MDEFSIIDVFFKSVSSNRSGLVKTGIGDDAAITMLPNGYELLVSTDTLVEGVHFLPDWPVKAIAYRALATNVSDIAAMAGRPCWCSLALTLPELDKIWLEEFSAGFCDALKTFNMDLIGGDITRGPLTITITIHGIVPVDKAIKRSGAKVDDAIFVTGALGAGAYGVSQLGRLDYQSKVFDKLFFPAPKHHYADLLQTYATSAIDISDGLSADLSHILKASKVGAILYQDKLPVAEAVMDKVPDSEHTDLALNSGDEYELCFRVRGEKKVNFIAEVENKKLCCYEVGKVTQDIQLLLMNTNHQTKPIVNNSFTHF